MPSSVRSPLNAETFFKFWAYKAFSKVNKKLSEADRCEAKVAAVVFGILTFGIGRWICRKYCYDRNIVSASRELAFQKQRLQKIFNSSDKQEKIDFLNDELRKTDPKKSEDTYQLFKKTKTDISDFVFKNDDIIIGSDFTDFYVHARKMCDLINQNYENNFERIKRLQQKIMNEDRFFEVLLTFCDFETVARHVLGGNNAIKEKFIAHLSTLDFAKFREKYPCIKTIALKPCEIYLSNRYETGRTLAFACEVLDALACEPIERDLKMQIINNTIRPITYNNQNLLWELLGKHCQTKDIPFLINYRFGFSAEECKIGREFVGNLMNPSNMNEWEAILPHVWDQMEDLYLETPRHTSKGEEDSVITEIIKSLTTKERFQIVIQSLCNHQTKHKSKLLLQCLNYTNPNIPLLPFSKRMEILKNILWPQIIAWANSENPQNWYTSPFSKDAINSLSGFFARIRTRLIELRFDQDTPLTVMQLNPNASVPLDEIQLFSNELTLDSKLALLLTCKTHYKKLFSYVQASAKEELLQLIKVIKQLNEKRQTLARHPLISDVSALELLLKSKSFSPGVLLQLKNLLEMTVFYAVMTNRHSHGCINTKGIEKNLDILDQLIQGL